MQLLHRQLLLILSLYAMAQASAVGSHPGNASNSTAHTRPVSVLAPPITLPIKEIEARSSITSETVLTPTMTFVGNYSEAGFYDVQVIGSLAYVASALKGFQVIDIRDPVRPKLLGSYDTPGEAHGVDVVGGLAYVADYYSLQIIDVHDPAHLTLRGSYATPGAALDVQVMGTLAYVAVANGGLRILDAADPAHPTLRGAYTGDGFSAYKIQIRGNLVYMVGATYLDTEAVIEIVDVSDPAMPRRRGNYISGGRSSYEDIYVAGDVAYVIGLYYPNSTSVAIFDVSNPATPTYQNSYFMPGQVRSVGGVGSLIFVGAWSGIQLLKTSNPISPTLWSSADQPGLPNEIWVVGELIYVADQDQGLEIFRLNLPYRSFLPVLEQGGLLQTPKREAWEIGTVWR